MTINQKKYLALLARRACNRAAALARGRGDEPGPELLDQEAFRHQAVVAACGKAGLRCCSQDDYGVVKGYLLEQLGEHGAAFEAQYHQQTNDRRVAEAVLVRECERAGLRLAYAEAICRRQYRLGLFEASEKQIWSLVFTVRNRASASRRKQKREQTEVELKEPNKTERAVAE